MTNSKAIWTVKTECGPIREKNEDAIYPNKSGTSSLPIKAGVFDEFESDRNKILNLSIINVMIICFTSVNPFLRPYFILLVPILIIDLGFIFRNIKFNNEK